MTHFTIDMLPAREGDCLWIEYGNSAKTHRILIDGGRSSAYNTIKARATALPANEREFDLMVCTHVDADHIEGLLKLVEDPDDPLRFKDVWFNGFIHLRRPIGTEVFGAKQGERLTDGIIDRHWPWNAAFGGGSVVVPDNGPLPEITLAGGMKATLLSPDWDALEKLRPVWRKECEKAGMVPGVDKKPAPPAGIERFGGLSVDKVKAFSKARYKRDTSKANAVSIALLLEFGGKAALLTGDAHAEIMIGSLKRADRDLPLPLEAMKLSHHGSRGTLSSDFLPLVDCTAFLVSTDGSRHGHPDREAIAKVVTARADKVTLIGNYRSQEMLEWDQQALKSTFAYEVLTPAASAPDGVVRYKLL